MNSSISPFVIEQSLTSFGTSSARVLPLQIGVRVRKTSQKSSAEFAEDDDYDPENRLGSGEKRVEHFLAPGKPAPYLHWRHTLRLFRTPKGVVTETGIPDQLRGHKLEWRSAGNKEEGVFISPDPDGDRLLDERERGLLQEESEIQQSMIISRGDWASTLGRTTGFGSIGLSLQDYYDNDEQRLAITDGSSPRPRSKILAIAAGTPGFFEGTMTLPGAVSPDGGSPTAGARSPEQVRGFPPRLSATTRTSISDARGGGPGGRTGGGPSTSVFLPAVSKSSVSFAAVDDGGFADEFGSRTLFSGGEGAPTMSSFYVDPVVEATQTLGSRWLAQVSTRYNSKYWVNQRTGETRWDDCSWPQHSDVWFEEAYAPAELQTGLDYECPPEFLLTAKEEPKSMFADMMEDLRRPEMS